mmetsp:Transcript_79361/g.220826  ORF Transcript_79361/g.220826 Transcript_79361/m.220826 type:complete len:434 (-) Transcript_79361:119-1420(-)
MAGLLEELHAGGDLLVELHAFIVEHVQRGGMAEDLVRQLREGLCGGTFKGPRDSGLFQVFRFAMTGVFSVRVTTLGGRSWSFDVNASTTAKALKAELEAQMGAPRHQQRLLCGSRVLDDARPLFSQGVTPTRATVMLVQTADSRLYAIGGHDAGGRALASGEVFDPAANSWTPLPAMLSRRADLAAAILEGKLYALGGVDGQMVLASTEVFDPETGYWMRAAPMAMARMGLAAAALDGRLVALGGSEYDRCLSTVEVYEPMLGVWKELPPMQACRVHFAAAAAEGKLYAVGGLDGGDQPLASAECFDMATGAWSALPTLSNSLSHLGAVAEAGRLLVCGGRRHGGLPSDAVEILDVGAHVWVTLAPMSLPRMRLGVGVANGRLYVVGGSSGECLASTEVLELGGADAAEAGSMQWTSLAMMDFRRTGLAVAAL